MPRGRHARFVWRSMSPSRCEEEPILRLRGTFSNNPRVRPLLDGTVKPTGIEIDWESGSPADLHERHLRDDDCDVFEFSISHFMESKAQSGQRWDWAMLPVYRSKALLCVGSLANMHSGVERAQDLKRKRFGVPDYSMTAALWFRAMLRELYGYHPWDISWFVGRTLEHSHTELVGVSREKLTSRVSITWPDRPGALGELLLAGKIDAAWGSTGEGIPPAPPDTLRPLVPGWWARLRRLVCAAHRLRTRQSRRRRAEDAAGERALGSRGAVRGFRAVESRGLSP